MASLVAQVPILLLISFDGFRHDYLSPALTPNLYALSQRSTVGNMRSLYVTKTYPNHFSIATGLYVDEHEIINNKMYDPTLAQPTFKPSTTAREWWDPHNRTVPIWTANQLLGDDRVSGSMMYPGSVTPYQGMVPVHLKPFDTVRNWTLNIDTVIQWLTDELMPANFVSVYFDNPDHTAHIFGPFSSQVHESLLELDHAVGYLMHRLQAEHLAQRTNVIFVSDHGMAQVSKRVYLDKLIDTSLFELYGASPVWSLWLKPNAMNMKIIIYKKLKRLARQNHFQVYKRNEIPQIYHYSKTPRIGHLLLVSDEGYDIYANASVDWTIDSTVWGNHGWSPTSEDMRPLFMATGPAFRAGYYHEHPFPNIDLFPLMCYILELPLRKLPNNGSLERISDMLATEELYRLTDSVVATDNNHHNSIGLVPVILGGIVLLIGGAMCMTCVASCARAKPKIDYDIDSLAPGLNIDLEFYLDHAGNKQQQRFGKTTLAINQSTSHKRVPEEFRLLLHN
ncbi:Bis(5'-adenosyl)-triphosphatase ENPP4 [Fragariocoptes setiger]|uniref:Bis(5'-adenosyl)-triphosphatase ENPP4 n=1 Tax=Fragariocoptes setiger TaxID=1670756 RepID=A0ABQ7S9A7_9ACAR|nr:Bis(5'-adenosyl)-triphosphatase ENPP4 [Fragariocoptes setiger]